MSLDPEIGEELEAFLEPVPEEQIIEWPGHPIIIPGQWPVYMVSPHRLRFWCMYDEDGQATALSCLANVGHPAAASVDDSMLSWILDARSRTDIIREDFCIRLGIAPLQPFEIELYADYSTDYWGETDLDWEWEIVQIRPMSVLETIANLKQLPL